MWAQDIRRLIKSQQMRMSVIYMYYLNTKCSPGHHHNGFMATGALGHTHAQVSTTSSYARFCSGNLSTLWFLECQQHVSPTKTFFPLYTNVLSPIFWCTPRVLNNLIRSTPVIIQKILIYLRE